MVDLDVANAGFRERVRLERTRLGLNQEQLSILLSDKGARSYSTAISKIEGGIRPARMDELLVLAEIFGLSIDVLVGRTAADPTRNKAYVMGKLSTWASQTLLEIQGQSATGQSRIDALDGFDLDDDEQLAVVAAEVILEGLHHAANQAANAAARMTFLRMTEGGGGVSLDYLLDPNFTEAKGQK